MTVLSGVGVGFRREIAADLLRTSRRLDWVEIVAENYLSLGGAARERLNRARDKWTVIPHSVSLSVGSFAPEGYEATLAAFVDELDPPFVSDHLCYSSLGGHAFLDLLPLPFHEEAARHAAKRASRAAETLGRRLLLENVTTYAFMPGSSMSESAFVRRVLELAGPNVGFLLDLANLHLNAVNHGLDPLALLAEMPLERVGQIHVAGSRRDGDVLLDTHSSPVADEVWQLLREALRRTGPVPVLVEWDQNIPSADAVLDQADIARDILAEVA